MTVAEWSSKNLAICLLFGFVLSFSRPCNQCCSAPFCSLFIVYIIIAITFLPLKYK
ncbi:hypothetical protein ACJW31_10G013000 [Castanea mollissima]